MEWHKNWFSNMIPFDDPLIYDGIYYFAPENFYQAMKLTPEQRDIRFAISQLEPKKAKVAIRKFKIRDDWNDALKLYFMEYALRHKFRLDTSHGKKLLENDDEIVEWNNWNDLWWGKDIETKEGKNNLGIILMRIRNDLKFEKLIN